MKKTVCIFLILAMLLCFAGCGAAGQGDQPEPSEGTSVFFETTDLKGNKMSSGDIFGDHDLTLVNLWGTYCGPCIREMPDLQVLNERLKEKNCAVVGIVIDVSSSKDTAMVRAAESIIEDTGVKYLNLVYWDGIFESFPAEYIPTSYLVDSQGRIVGGPSVGSMSADDYEAFIDEALKSLEK